jgi:nuclear GTP-binding protein
MGLLEDESKTAGKVCHANMGLCVSLTYQKPHIVETEPFSNTFGPKAQRKRPRLDIGSFEELGESSSAAAAANPGG